MFITLGVMTFTLCNSDTETCKVKGEVGDFCATSDGKRYYSLLVRPGWAGYNTIYALTNASF